MVSLEAVNQLEKIPSHNLILKSSFFLSKNVNTNNLKQTL